jgi:nitrogen fixation NifU-like protein
MSELRDLYQETILDHSKSPRNFHELEGADASADGHNPLCGDRIRLFVKIDGDRIEKVSFTGSGCAISTASASMMAEALEGKTIEESDELFRAFHELLARDGNVDEAAGRLGKLIVFSGVREFPMRVKCATLPWHTLTAALRRQNDPVSTE